jgi:hypothetical protein
MISQEKIEKAIKTIENYAPGAKVVINYETRKGVEFYFLASYNDAYLLIPSNSTTGIPCLIEKASIKEIYFPDAKIDMGVII